MCVYACDCVCTLRHHHVIHWARETNIERVDDARRVCRYLLWPSEPNAFTIRRRRLFSCRNDHRWMTLCVRICKWRSPYLMVSKATPSNRNETLFFNEYFQCLLQKIFISLDQWMRERVWLTVAATQCHCMLSQIQEFFSSHFRISRSIGKLLFHRQRRQLPTEIEGRWRYFRRFVYCTSWRGNRETEQKKRVRKCICKKKQQRKLKRNEMRNENARALRM